MKATKRIRSINWSEQEKNVLKRLVLERADVIEKKDTSANTNSAKKIAWEEVLSCFNTINSRQRDITQLQNQWRNFKNRTKKEHFARRRSRTITRGSPRASPSSEDQEMMEVLPQHFLSVDSNCYNSDTSDTIQPETSQHEWKRSETSSRLGPTSNTDPSIEKKHQIKKSRCCSETHAHQLFIIASTERKEAMLREKEAHDCKMKNERELHERRMNLLTLEEEYWKMKISQLKQM